MGFKELVEGASDILGVKFEYSEEKNVYSIAIEFEDNQTQVVNVYQDVYEDDLEGVSKKIIVSESLVDKFNSSKNIIFLSKSNNDMFFSKAYISESEDIMVENCSFMEGLNNLNLSIIIAEIAEYASFLKEKM